MTREFNHPTIEEMDQHLRRARRARSQALVDTGHWFAARFRAAVDAIVHAYRDTPHGPAQA